MMKTCSRCEIDKEFKDFYGCKRNKDGKNYHCIDCEKKRLKSRKEERKKYEQKRREKNREKIRENCRKYEQNPETKARRKILRAKRRLENLIKTRRKEADNQKKRIKNNTCYKLHNLVSKRVLEDMKKNRSSKNRISIREHLPYSLIELKASIEKQWEPWMNWENHGRISHLEKTWHIDHVIPCSLLPYDSYSHPNFLKCWSLENLRPLEAFANVKKGNKILSSNQEFAK